VEEGSDPKKDRPTSSELSSSSSSPMGEREPGHWEHGGAMEVAEGEKGRERV
jgi:hypothetical protein